MARVKNLFARPTDSENQNSGAPVMGGYDDKYSTGVRRRMADLRYGGQMGYSPDFSTWVNFHPYVSRNLIPILIEAPLGFKALPDQDHWIGALKSLVEVMPMSVQGLNAQLDVSVDQVPFGGAGQEFEVFTNVKEQKSDIQFTFAERVGMPVYRFLSSWIRLFMMDPNTKNATINTIPGSELADLMADQYSMTMLFIEPDELHRFVNQAWLVTNMWPKTTGENTAKREMAADMARRDVSVNFTGIAQYGAGVDDFAQMVLNEINIVGADPHAREAFIKDISDYVRGLKGQGYETSAEDIRPINRILNPTASQTGGETRANSTGAYTS